MAYALLIFQQDSGKSNSFKFQTYSITENNPGDSEKCYYYWADSEELFADKGNIIELIAKRADFPNDDQYFKYCMTFQPSLYVIQKSQEELRPHMRNFFIKEIKEKTYSLKLTPTLSKVLDNLEVIDILGVEKGKLKVSKPDINKCRGILKGTNSQQFTFKCENGALYIEEIGKEVNFGTRHIQNVNNLLSLHNPGDIIEFRCYDNTTIEINYDTLRLIHKKMLEHLESLYKKKWENLSLIEKIEDLDSFIDLKGRITI